MRPRATAAIIVAPATVTDLTCHVVLGLEPRPYRRLLTELLIPHVVLGRRMIANVADVLAAIARASVTNAGTSDEQVAPDEESTNV